MKSLEVEVFSFNLTHRCVPSNKIGEIFTCYNFSFSLGKDQGGEMKARKSRHSGVSRACAFCCFERPEQQTKMSYYLLYSLSSVDKDTLELFVLLKYLYFVGASWRSVTPTNLGSFRS